MTKRGLWNAVPLWALGVVALALGVCGTGVLIAGVAAMQPDQPGAATAPCAGMAVLETLPLEVYDAAGGSQVRVGNERDDFLGFAASGDRILRLDDQIRRGPGMVDVKVCLTTGKLAGRVGYVSNQAVRAAR